MNTILDHIKKYDAKPDEKVVSKLVNNLRLVMRNADARYVAASDPEELARVVKNFCIKKLGVDETKAKAAVDAVAQQMKDEHNKNRVVFYYLVAKKLNKFSEI